MSRLHTEAGTRLKVARRGRRRAIFVALAAFLVSAVIAISFLPSQDKHVLHTRGKYHSWGHLVVFGVVAYVLARASRTLRARVLLFVGSIAFGFTIEYVEHLVFGAPIEWQDILVDTLGVLCGAGLAMLNGPAE